MGNNLLWLIQEKYPDKKIIVWAANFHITKNTDKIEPKKKTYVDIVTTGNEIFNAIGNQAYILGFNSYSGNFGRVGINKTFNIKKPKGESFENWVSQKKYDYAFINFRNLSNITNSFNMKGLRHISEKGNWTQVFDGIFYIKTMYPCDKIE
tara:strand:+ start:541 stop:993 length:453 start_codon:yes stop_codon:yes gene_type:complete